MRIKSQATYYVKNRRCASFKHRLFLYIITKDALNKDNNILNQKRDSLENKKPVDLLKQTNPILILDEPQNMESSIVKNALENLNPLFTLRYSATHKVAKNKMYRLTPYESYKQGLVKKIL